MKTHSDTHIHTHSYNYSPPSHPHIYTESCKHIYATLTKDNSYKKLLTCVLIHMHTYTYVHTHLYTYTQPHILTQNDHANIRTDVGAPISVNTHMLIHMYKQTRLYMHTEMLTCAIIYPHTHTPIHT